MKYLIVGGFAVAFHGHPRNTLDIDVFVEMTPENATRLVAVLMAIGFASLGLKSEDSLAPKTIIQLGQPPNRIDILTTLSGVDFDQAWEGRILGEDDGLALPFIGKAKLLANKAATGRPKDLADIHALS